MEVPTARINNRLDGGKGQDEGRGVEATVHERRFRHQGSYRGGQMKPQNGPPLHRNSQEPKFAPLGRHVRKLYDGNASRHELGWSNCDSKVLRKEA
eukprot:scaffold585_cov330-Pavlova_lutheri.AAC.7